MYFSILDCAQLTPYRMLSRHPNVGFYEFQVLNISVIHHFYLRFRNCIFPAFFDMSVLVYGRFNYKIVNKVFQTCWQSLHFLFVVKRVRWEYLCHQIQCSYCLMICYANTLALTDCSNLFRATARFNMACFNKRFLTVSGIPSVLQIIEVTKLFYRKRVVGCFDP